MMGLTTYFVITNYIIPPIQNDWLLRYSRRQYRPSVKCCSYAVQGGCASVYLNGGAQGPMGSWRESDHIIAQNISQHAASTEALRLERDMYPIIMMGIGSTAW